MMLDDDDDDDDAGPAATQRTFFDALCTGDTSALAELLADGFVMIDGARGSEVSRRDFIRDVELGRLRFDDVRVIDSRLRRYGDAAVLPGRVEMRRRFGAIAWRVRAQFTHVLVVERGRFRLASLHENGFSAPDRAM